VIDLFGDTTIAELEAMLGLPIIDGTLRGEPGSISENEWSNP